MEICGPLEAAEPQFMEYVIVSQPGIVGSYCFDTRASKPSDIWWSYKVLTIQNAVIIYILNYFKLAGNRHLE